MKNLAQQPDRSLVAPRREVDALERRLFFKQGLSLGALTLLSGCDITDADAVQKVLWPRLLRYVEATERKPCPVMRPL